MYLCCPSPMSTKKFLSENRNSWGLMEEILLSIKGFGRQQRHFKSLRNTKKFREINTFWQVIHIWRDNDLAIAWKNSQKTWRKSLSKIYCRNSTVCGDYRNLLSKAFGKNFVKQTYLLKSWLDEKNFWWELIFHFMYIQCLTSSQPNLREIFRFTFLCK